MSVFKKEYECFYFRLLHDNFKFRQKKFKVFDNAFVFQ